MADGVRCSKISKPDTQTDDDGLAQYLEELKNRSELRILFSVSKNATREDVMRAVAIIEALKERGRRTFMTDGTIFVRRLHNLPLTVRGVTTPNPDGRFQSISTPPCRPRSRKQRCGSGSTISSTTTCITSIRSPSMSARPTGGLPHRQRPVPASAAALHCAQHMSGRCAPDESAAAGTNASSSPRCVAAPTVRAPRAALDELEPSGAARLEKRLYDVG